MKRIVLHAAFVVVVVAAAFFDYRLEIMRHLVKDDSLDGPEIGAIMPDHLAFGDQIGSHFRQTFRQMPSQSGAGGPGDAVEKFRRHEIRMKDEISGVF